MIGNPGILFWVRSDIAPYRRIELTMDTALDRDLIGVPAFLLLSNFKRNKTGSGDHLISA